MFFTLLQNGAVLGVEENLENMWKQGMQSYSDKRWQEAIESIEQSLKLYEMYQNATKLCLKACVNTSTLVCIQSRQCSV